MHKLTRAEFFALFDKEVHPALRRASGLPGTTHLVCFENVDMSSSRLGQRTAVAIGPGRTWKSIDQASKGWLNDLPSMRQYPVSYWEVEP